MSQYMQWLVDLKAACLVVLGRPLSGDSGRVGGGVARTSLQATGNFQELAGRPLPCMQEVIASFTASGMIFGRTVQRLVVMPPGTYITAMTFQNSFFLRIPTY
jgi:hypothetical protein